MPQTPTVRNLLLAAVAVTLPLVGIAVGQDQQPAQRVVPARPVQVPRGGLNPDSFYGKESFQGVSVRDSLEAIKKLEDARRMERLEDWNKAADWYQEVLEKYGQYVVPSGTDAQNNIRQYTGIERPVQEQLAKWPKAGLDAYRNRYGAVANTLLQQARPDDRETLSKVMKLYFVTDAGKTAGVRLVDLLLEAGEFPEAARVGDRLLDWHPDLVVERPKVLFRTALAYHLAGDAAKATERAEQLKSKHAGAVGTLFGKDVVLTDALDGLLKVSPPVAVATANGSVRYNPGGDESRSLISAAKGRPGARLASVEILPPPVKGAPNLDPDMIGRGNNTGGPGVLPVTDGDDLFFQDGSRIYAVNLQSGVPLPGWTQSYPNSFGTYTISAANPGRGGQYTLTLTDDAVLGVMGFSERAANNVGLQALGSDRGTRLVSLDRETGKERWVARPNRIAEENLRALDFSGSPLVVGENVYVLGRGGRNPTSEDCYVLCFDLNTGAYKWSCFIASANNPAAFTGQAPVADTLSHLAYSTGRVYVLTNVGACAALDAYSGTITWLNIYPRDTAMIEQGMGFRAMRGGMMIAPPTGRPWESNPVVVRDGKVFILPTDSKHLIVYDAGTGAELKRIPTADVRQQASNSNGTSDPTPPAAILGVDASHVFLSGEKSVYCIDWTRPVDDLLVWHSPFLTTVRGRGFVTADAVYVCTAPAGTERKGNNYGGLHRLIRFGPTGEPSGKRVESYPPDRDWDNGEGPGNVVVSGDQVIVASTKRVNVYADMNLARKRLDDDVAAAPTEPGPRLRYAEVMFVAGQHAVAMEKLDETVALLGGLKSLRPGPDRDHLFNDCITFANKLRTSGGDGDELTAKLTRLYDLAAAAADGDSQQVNYRMSRAEFNRKFVQDDSLATAVALYQEILTSDRLRIVPLTAEDDAGGTTQAAVLAEHLIDEIKKQKPEAYAATEKLAGEMLEAAGSDPALLKKVADSYPNSVAAPKAMIAAAAAYEGQSNYRMAVYTLRQAYRKYGESSDKPRLLESMARNYLAMPDRTADRVDTAAARLSAIVKVGAGSTTLAKPLKLPGEKVLADAGVTVNDALKALQGFKAEAVTSKLPDFHLAGAMTESDKAQLNKARAAWLADGGDPAKRPKPPEAFAPADQRVVVPGIASLVKPPLDLRQRYARHDRLVAFAEGSLLLFPIGATEPIGRSTDVTAPRNLAWIDNNASLLVWGANEIALLSGDDAKKKWRLELKSLPKIEVVTGGQSEESLAQNDALNPQQQEIFIGGNGIRAVRMARINGRPFPGVPVQQLAQAAAAPAAPETIADVVPVDDKIICSTTAGQLFALRTADGKLAWHTRLSATAPLNRVAATDDFTVVKVDDPTTTQLVVLDTLTGQLVRRIPFTNAGQNVPVNFALAPDGTLVWIQRDRLCGKDLVDPKSPPTYEIVAGQDASAPRGPNVGNLQADGQMFTPVYDGATNPDQLVISEGRVLVVTANGAYVEVHSLETGKLLDFKQDKNGPAGEARWSTRGDPTKAIADWGVALNLVGSKLFVTSRRNGPICYDLDKGTMIWAGHVDQNTTPNVQFQEPFIGQDFFVIVNRPLPTPNAQPSPNTIQPHCYSRAISDGPNGRESGLLRHSPVLRDDSGITDITAVEGGLYYLSGDKKLHFLKGARQ